MGRALFAIALVLCVAASALAGAKAGDITIDSEVDSVTTIATGRGKTETNVHSVKIHDGHSVGGNIVIQGREGDVVNINTKNKNKTVNRGSVIVGPRN